NVHQPQFLGVCPFRQNALDAECLGRDPDDDLQQIAFPQLEILRGTTAQVDAVRMKECEQAAANIADERGLQRGGTKRVYSQYLQRLATPGQSHVQLKHGARLTPP